MGDYACSETRITNVSDITQTLSMFGGKRVDVNEVFTVPGTVWAWLAGRFPGIKGARMIKKMHDLIDDGILRILTAPSAPCGDTRVFGSSSSSSSGTTRAFGSSSSSSSSVGP